MKLWILGLTLCGLLFSGPSRADETVGTLVLDGLSFVSFEHVENLAIPSGSTIRFRFGVPDSGVAPFTIQPADVAISAMPLPDGQGELRYTLSSPAAGSIRQGENGLIVQFDATVLAVVNHPTMPGSQSHTLRFTTEHASATSLNTGDTISIEGLEAIPGPRYLQLVGAVANPKSSFPEGGAAVYTVLSGSFDWLPDLD